MNFMNAFDQSGDNQPHKSGLEAFDQADAAPEWTPLPAGFYTARIVSGTLMQTKKGDDAYGIVFEVTEGDQKGKRTSRIWTFTKKAIKYVKRDLAVFGLSSSQQLLEPYPPTGREYYVRLMIALQRRDDGTETNDVKRVVMLEPKAISGAAFLLESNKPAQSEGGEA